MSIPNETEFNSYIELLSTFHAKDIARKIYFKQSTNLEEIADLIHQGKKEIARISKIDSKVEEWLEHQPAFSIAQNRAFLVKKSDSVYSSDEHEKYIKELAGIVIQLVKDQKSDVIYKFNDIDDTSRLYKYLNRILGIHIGAKWRIALLKALIEYYFTDKAFEISKCHKDLSKFLEETRNALHKAQNAIDVQFSKHNDILDFSRIDHQIQRAIKSLEQREFNLNVEHTYPIKRNNKTAKERLFIYRMERVHRTLFRSPRPEAISLLFDLEGFHHSFDTRQVEKMCASFKDSRNKRRQLYDDY